MIRMMAVVSAAVLLVLAAAVAQSTDQPWQDDPLYILSQADPSDDPVEGPPGMIGRRLFGQGKGEGKHLEQFRMLKLLELLDLNEDQEVAFITGFRSFRRSLRQLDEQKGKLLADLAGGLKDETISEREIDRHIGEIMKLEQERRQKMDDFLREARGVLTPQQMGKLVIFQERFEFELLDKVRAFRERAGRRGIPHGDDSTGQ
ncbi:MAG: hypothetical protein OEW00_00690 [candidate division Zixibacteria bacterium]|nr:hypothetical protein [candidate division Zixibacteria bacterium]